MIETLGNICFLALFLGIVLAIFGLAKVIPYLLSIRPLRPKEPGFRYVRINEDGSARELDEDEMDYLNTDFEGGDSGRPYIKENYRFLTPDGKMHGYLWRCHLPKGVPIDPPPPPSLTQND